MSLLRFSLCFLVVAICGDIVDGHCHDGWVKYHDSCYIISRENKTWVDAFTYCQIFGGFLVAINDPLENAFLLNQLSLLFNNDPAKGVTFYTGGTDTQLEGEWIWAGTSESLFYNDWFYGEPNDLGGTENCIVIIKDRDFHWNDGECNVLRNFICEAKSSPSTSDGNVGGYIFG